MFAALWFLFFPGVVLALDSFITLREYGAMLYQDPRGIGCHHCHGPRGEGGEIAPYSHKGVKMKLLAPSIRNLSKERLSSAIGSGEFLAMPRYHLTEDEIGALHLFLGDTPVP